MPLELPPHDVSLAQWLRTAGLDLADNIGGLRPQQEEALAWAAERPEPYLFVNAPTGSGKTLIAGVYGAMRAVPWTYAVHTIRLQEQVARTFTNLPVLTGRRNHPCWVGEQIYGVKAEYDAGQGICVVDRSACEHSSRPAADGEGYRAEGLDGFCPYYRQMDTALTTGFRVANYAMMLSLPPLQQATSTLLADEGHNVEEAVCSSVSVLLSARTMERFRIRVPQLSTDLPAWAEWATDSLKRLPSIQPHERPDFGLLTAYSVLKFLSTLERKDEGHWLVEQAATGVTFQPIWGRGFVMQHLFGHDEAPPNADAYESAQHRQGGVQKVVLLSATLMGAEYIASTLGFPDGSWAYLDLPSTFPVANRPINYSPVVRLGYASTDDDYAKMQEAIDKLIEHYILNGKAVGIVHAVSNNYRDKVLTNSRFCGIMHATPEEHEAAIKRGEASVLVAANLAEGWDGYDDLCRFVIMPKVPFPSLGDRRTKIRMQEDSRSYDHKALVAVVQGAGRGVRHREDYCDTWILDGNWQQLYSRRREWLPDSFTSAYHHRVALV